MKFYMVVLALDTTTRQGSVALTRDGILLGCEAGDPNLAHGARLPGDLIRLLEGHALEMGDVDLFAIATGPGSFTGLRIGIATMQGLALATGRPLVGVSALDALNAAARTGGPESPVVNEGQEIGVWMNAQRSQVFSSLYDGERVLDGPTAETPAALLARWRDGGMALPRIFVGDGALVYASLIRHAVPTARIRADVPLLAPCVARLGEESLQRHGPASPDAIQALYVRRPDVELARDRAKA